MKQKSFTLIELLVVIAIIGLLASIVIVNLTGTRSKANIAKGLQFSQSVHHALGSEAVGVWSFDEGSGTTAYDASGYGNNGTINGASYTTDSPSNTGYALNFDGVNDYVDVPDSSSLDITTALTIGAWVNYRTIPMSYGSIMTKRIWHDVKGGYSFHFYNNKLRFDYGDGVNFEAVFSDLATFSPNTYYYMVITYDGTNIRFYKNGSLFSTKAATYSSIGANTTGLYLGIGYAATSGFYFQLDGLIDEVRIYEKALETAQIESLYYAGLDSLLAKGLIDKQGYQERLLSMGLRNP